MEESYVHFLNQSDKQKNSLNWLKRNSREEDDLYLSDMLSIITLILEKTGIDFLKRSNFNDATSASKNLTISSYLKLNHGIDHQFLRKFLAYQWDSKDAEFLS